MMEKRKEFDNILDECLERILTRGETVEQCLASYPEEAVELEPLLQTSLAAKRATAIRPRPEFRDRARYQLQAALRDMEEKRARRFSLFSWQPRWATAIVAVLVLLLASGGTVAAAGNSMPDGTLYPVKLAAERVRLALTPSALGKAELHVKLADKRVAEIIRMAEKGKPEHVEQVTRRLNAQLVAMTALVGPPAGEAGIFTVPTPSAVREAPTPAMVEAPPEKEAVIMAPPPPAAAREAPPLPVAPKEAPILPEVREDEDENGDTEVERLARLRMILARNAAEHPEALRAALARVPESARPALLRAIAASGAEYEKALRFLQEREAEREREREEEREEERERGRERGRER